MNHVTNDRGETVIAVGMPSSVEWVKVRYPKLVDRIIALHDGNALEADVIDEIRAAGVTGEMETTSLLEAGHYRIYNSLEPYDENGSHL